MQGEADFLLFIAQKVAIDLSNVWNALHTANTWADFRAKMPNSEYAKYMVRSFDDVDAPQPRPSDESTFQPTEDGWMGGDWPANPMYWMDTWVPERVMALASANTILADQEPEALKILHEAGFLVERNDKLAKDACGEWFTEREYSGGRA